MHHRLLHPEPEPLIRDAAGLAGGTTVEPCCATHWGTRPGSIDWNKGAPIMICTATPEFVTAFPNCGDPKNLSQAFPLSYDKPKFAVGVAWPDPNEYRYELQSVPIVDGPDGTCAAFSQQPGKVSKWWVHEIKEPKRGTYVFTAAVSFRQGDTAIMPYSATASLRRPPVRAASAQ